MSLKKISLFLYLSLLLGIVDVAAQTVNLQGLVERALDENYQIRVVRNQQQMAQNQNTPGNAGFLPSLNLRADQVWGVQNTQQEFFNGEERSGNNARSTRQDAVLEIDWTLFDGFRMFASRNRLEALEEMGRAEAQFYIQQTIADISTLYYQLLMEMQLKNSFEKSFAISTFRLRLEEQKRNLGTGNALLYHQALIDFNADSAMLVNQQMTIRDLQISLNYIINADPEMLILPADSLIPLDGIPPATELLEKTMQNNREVERARLQEVLMEAQGRIERSYRYPEISIFGNYSYSGQSNEVGFLEKSIQYGGQYGIRVRFNLYDGGRQNIRVNNSLLEAENATLLADDTRREVESNLASMLNAYDAFAAQHKLLESSLEAAEKSLAIAQQQLQEGIISGFEFRQAQMASLNVQNQLTRLLDAMKSIEIDVMRISGEVPESIL